MKKMIILLVAMLTGTSQTNYSRETISKPHGIEAILDLLEKGNGSLGIYQGAIDVIYAPPFFTDSIASDTAEFSRPPFLGKSYNGFKEALAFQESRGDYFAINSFGYLGKYQFGEGTLEVLKVADPEKFLNDPRLQEEVFYANLARNKWILRREIKKHTNKVIRTINITESGILAAAHLAGPGNVKKYLRSGGKHNVQDAYGTQISDYLRKFAGYDISNARDYKG
ncbi:MAG: hypothetical protein HKP60_12330, partial [Eudoraea sp.]|nr:hypothetical protein [Eudoraea sp.]NNJ41649.1 hypothetical protein [Eudoraea sp.]